MEYLATSAEALALSVDEWFDKYGVAILKREEEAIASLGKFYPKTLSAFGGVKGLRKWLAGVERMPKRISHIFLAENDKVLNQQERFEALNQSEMFSVLCNAY